MARIDENIINFALYENSTEYCGMVEVTLPDISNLTEEISGAGIAGKIEAVMVGHIEAMTTTFNFRTVTDKVTNLMKPEEHSIDLRVAQQFRNTTSQTVGIDKVKHIMRVKPKKTSLGKVAPASPADVSGEYAVSYWAMYINDIKRIEIDPANFICYIHGKDYLADVKKALGK